MIEVAYHYKFQINVILHVQELNNRWRSLQQLAEERSNMLGSAHEVQRFHRYSSGCECGHIGQKWGEKKSV